LNYPGDVDSVFDLIQSNEHISDEIKRSLFFLQSD